MSQNGMNEDEAAMDPSSPEPAQDAPAAQPLMEQAPAVAPTPLAAPVAAPVEAPAGLPPKPDVLPVAGTVNVVGKRRPAMVTAEELAADDNAFADDLAKGYIKPQTMQSLYGKQDTLGKIGTIFGLLVGGAGAGLTKQPNAVLAMMQKEIDNDLEAQKASAGNRQNWLKLSIDQKRQEAERQKLAADTALSKAELEQKLPAELAGMKSVMAKNYADAQLTGMSSAKVKMQLAALSHLTGMVANMPDGPAKQAASQSLTNVVMPAMMQDIQNTHKNTAGMVNVRSALRGDVRKEAPQDVNGTGVDTEKAQQLMTMGQAGSALDVPGLGMNPAQAENFSREAKIVAGNRAVAKMYADAFNRLDEEFAAGRWNKNAYDAEIAALGQQIAGQLGAGSEAQVEHITKSMFPTWNDWGRARQSKFRHAVDAFKANEAATPTLDQFNLKTPFPELRRAKEEKRKTTEAKAKPSSIPDGTPGRAKDGTPLVRQGGKWVPAEKTAGK